MPLWVYSASRGRVPPHQPPSCQENGYLAIAAHSLILSFASQSTRWLNKMRRSNSTIIPPRITS